MFTLCFRHPVFSQFCTRTHHKNRFCVRLSCFFHVFRGGSCAQYLLSVQATRLHVHVSLWLRLHAVVVRWSDCMELRWLEFALRGRWDGMLLHRKWQDKVPSASRPFARSLRLNCSFHLSLPLSPSRSFSLSPSKSLTRLNLAVFQRLSGST